MKVNLRTNGCLVERPDALRVDREYQVGRDGGAGGLPLIVLAFDGTRAETKGMHYLAYRGYKPRVYGGDCKVSPVWPKRTDDVGSALDLPEPTADDGLQFVRERWQCG